MKYSILVLLLLVLAGCGGGLSEEDAADAVRAAIEGDRDAANEHLCEDDQISQPEATSRRAVGLDVLTISCDKDGDAMACDTTVRIPAVGDQTQTFTFNIEDDKLCGGDINSLRIR
jgi:hypothetical protein